MTQELARAYDVQCTPHFFGFNAQDDLYRGRLDASRTTLVPNARCDLFVAMKQWPKPAMDRNSKCLRWDVPLSGSARSADGVSTRVRSQQV